MKMPLYLACLLLFPGPLGRTGLAQDRTNATVVTLQVGTNATNQLVVTDARKGALHFGLARYPALQRTVMNIPLWQYLASIIFVAAAFYISKLVGFLVRTRLQRMVPRGKTIGNDLLLELLGGPIRMVLFVILIHIGLNLFLWPAWFAGALSRGLKLAVAVYITYILLRGVDLVINYWRARSQTAERGLDTHLLPFFRNTLKVFVLIVAVLFTLQNLNVNITSLIASLSIGGLAIGLAAQDTLANLFGAVAVLIDKPFRVGDRIRLDPNEGVVESIGFRSTQIRNADGHLVSIPNKAVGNATIINIQQRPSIRTVMNIGLTYDTPGEKVERALAITREVYGGHPMTLDLSVAFNRFSETGLNLEVVHVWKTTDYKAYLAGFESLNVALKQKFDTEGIRFALPSRIIYLRQESPLKIDAGSETRPVG